MSSSKCGNYQQYSKVIKAHTLLMLFLEFVSKVLNILFLPNLMKNICFSDGLVRHVSIRRNAKEAISNGEATRKITPEPCYDYVQSGDNSIRILIGIVVLFSSCHFLRLFLQCYHHIAADNYRQCVNNGIVQKEIPYWLWPLTAINHMCLVLNSSINFLLYCWLGSKFRYNLVKEFRNLFSKQKAPSNTTRTRPLFISKNEQNGKFCNTHLIKKIKQIPINTLNCTKPILFHYYRYWNHFKNFKCQERNVIPLEFQ